MPKKDVTSDWRAQEAAFLRARRHMSQGDIGKLLRLSQSQVSRLLNHAEAKGWFQRMEIFNFIQTPDISEERMAEIRRLLDPLGLTERLQRVQSKTGVQVRTVQILDSGSTDISPEGLEERLKRFGRLAAGRLEELFSSDDYESEVWAVTWGESVGRIIDSLAGSHSRLHDGPIIQFVPVCAEAAGPSTTAFSSSRLASQLNEVVNNGRGDQLSLAGVAAFIPRGFEEKQAVQRFISINHSYERIFTGKQPLIKKADALLTSIGSAERPLGFCNTELLQNGGIDAHRLKSLIVGDMAGVLIPRRNLSPDEYQEIDDLNDMWTGIQLDDLIRIATNAAKNVRKPGNVVVALGSSKASALEEMIRYGLINELIIDNDLAGSLKIPI